VGRWSSAAYGDRRMHARVTGAACYAASATDKWAPAPFHNFNDFQSPEF
jgi:hypothetical protein